MKYDLHCHSTCSDGTYAPTEVVKRAHAAGINVLALTDHDTLVGIDEAREAANAYDIQLINGVEISCEHTLSGGYGKNKSTNKIIHVLGLDFTDREKMHATLQQLQDSRATRGQRIIKKLSELLDIDFVELWQAVLDKAGGNAQAVGRAHIGQVLFERGEVKTVQKAFDKYLADNKPAYVAIEALTMQHGIELIHACGGRAVLAHPTRYQLSATRVRKLIGEFAQLGGDACELPATSEPISTRRMVDRSIAEHNLVTSIGSDFHGSNMPWRCLGDVPILNEDQQGVWELFNTPA
ncbi:PHP domain-containing protein [Psychrobacter pacificensis]|uniref:PHP domain-containing protein n=1 Tax=Psychrobacter pacificensis TaxID=112002 RepID=UPI001CBFE8FF|nr:PHP domain-containing protein [Psychrobacter pacificensis]MBZ1392183.1 PHP domain-containing protein [Psychrobacter pacificensis]MDE0843995.1 PHP domain-containing protein [Psychrobacter pacificensis]